MNTPQTNTPEHDTHTPEQQFTIALRRNLPQFSERDVTYLLNRVLTIAGHISRARNIPGFLREIELSLFTETRGKRLSIQEAHNMLDHHLSFLMDCLDFETHQPYLNSHGQLAMWSALDYLATYERHVQTSELNMIKRLRLPDDQKLHAALEKLVRAIENRNLHDLKAALQEDVLKEAGQGKEVRRYLPFLQDELH